MMVGKRDPFLRHAASCSGYPFLLYLPTSYGRSGLSPLVLFLHGSGERGNDLDLIRRHGPPRIVDEGGHFPFILLCPQCPKGRTWSAARLGMLLDQVADAWRVDLDQIYVTGLSMGGYGTWRLALRFPNRFAAIAPICGGGSTRLAHRLKDLPAWAFHGALDEHVPLIETENMVRAVEQHGGHVRFTIYPEAGHDAWTKTYRNPELYLWLLDHRRIPPLSRA